MLKEYKLFFFQLFFFFFNTFFFFFLVLLLLCVIGLLRHEGGNQSGEDGGAPEVNAGVVVAQDELRDDEGGGDEEDVASEKGPAHGLLVLEVAELADQRLVVGHLLSSLLVQVLRLLGLAQATPLRKVVSRCHKDLLHSPQLRGHTRVLHHRPVLNRLTTHLSVRLKLLNPPSVGVGQRLDALGLVRRLVRLGKEVRGGSCAHKVQHRVQGVKDGQVKDGLWWKI